MSGRFEDQTVLVTGGSKGIGRSIGIAFAREGAHVVLTYAHNEKEATEARKEALEARSGDTDVRIVKADVVVEDEVEQMLELARKGTGRLDVLVNNAGIQEEAAAHKTDLEAFEEVLNVDLLGAFLCARGALRHFLDRGDGGVILNVSSVHEAIPKPYYIGYSCAKGGMQNLTRTLALEYADRGIRVNAIAPGATATPINPWSKDPEETKKVADHVPLGRVAQPDEMSHAALFLCSDQASYITGQTLFIDGGLSLYPDFQTSWSS